MSSQTSEFIDQLDSYIIETSLFPGIFLQSLYLSHLNIKINSFYSLEKNIKYESLL